MKKIFFIFLLVVFYSKNVFAVTLKEALLIAYKNNPTLNAERENLSISREDINIAKSDFLPSITLSGSKSEEDTTKLTNSDGSRASLAEVNPEVKTVLIEQTIFQGFGGIADLKKNKLGLDISEAKLLKVEQEILYLAVDAYTGLILANKKFKINQSNVSLLERQVETDQSRLEKGQISLADLAQSESSLAGANAKFIESKNKLITSKLNYENIIGPIDNFDDLKEKSSINYKLPENLMKANKISKKNNPELIIAKLELEQSEKDVQIAKSELSPSATLSFESSETDDYSSTYQELDKETLQATITWPIFSGGKNSATLKKNKNLNNQKKLLLDNTIKENNTNVASAWSNFQYSKSFLNSVKSQVKAAEIANEGITVEYESGLGRSTLDVIQSNAFLLESKISLANSERNYLLSQFKLLQSVGLLTSKYLQIN
jgi:outer membrane protein